MAERMHLLHLLLGPLPLDDERFQWLLVFVLPQILQPTVDSPGQMTSLPSDNQAQFFAAPSDAAVAASRAVAEKLRRNIAAHGRAVALFDSFLRPVDFFDQLAAERDIDWTQVIVFQAGEFMNESADSPTSCQRFLTEHLVLRVPIVSFHAMRGDAPNQRAATVNFSERITQAPPDLAFVSFHLLSAIQTTPPSSEMIGRAVIGNREAIAVTSRALAVCAEVFVLGTPTARDLLSHHPGAHFFLYANP